MPLRALALIAQLGLSPDRILIESYRGDQSIDVLLHITEERGALLIEKLRSMVLVESATLSRGEPEASVARSAIVEVAEAEAATLRESATS